MTPVDWTQKLAAFLHDPPGKALDIVSHEDAAELTQRQAGLNDGSFNKLADHVAAAADRLPFPYYKSSKLSCSFDGVNNPFHHPLGGGVFKFSKTFPSVELELECQQVTQPAQLEKPADWAAAELERAEFFAHWRLWSDWLTEKDARCAFLPADTRIPDHTIFQHNAVTSAFAGCLEKPALLRFHLGPVQSFIAAARSTRDLWSGSYLLSWLITTGLKKLTESIGPDAVIFPNLIGQPLFDLLWRDELWSKMKSHCDSQKSIWEGFKYNSEQLLTPNFPNVFLALVPETDARELAIEVENAIREEWTEIADSVWKFAELKKGKERFEHQIKRHLSLSWQVTPFPETLDKAENIAESLPEKSLKERFNIVRNTFEKTMPSDHRDKRFYDIEGKLNNYGLAWSLVVALNSWQLDAVRQTRTFDAWGIGGAADGQGMLKDALNGKEEEIPLTGIAEKAKNFFEHNDPVGATTLVKRLWHLAYLKEKFGFKDSDFNMPNTHSIAKCSPYRNDEKDGFKDTDEEGGKYFAILAFDGDDMGKWVSGANTPKFKEQLADYQENGGRKGALEYFERINAGDFLDTQRLLTPSYHLQFSEALSNFALYVAPRIVNAYSGRLIYAGGDDVLAMLPAPNALACANDLQRAFSGKAPQKKECGVQQVVPGFLTVDCRFGRDQNGRYIPFIVPGGKATASVGIAMAHFKAPLQDVVRAAQAAEKRAKKHGSEKNAFAVSVFKRSGEISEWEGAFREPATLAVFGDLLRLMKDEILSSKFPHKLLEFIVPYRSTGKMQDYDSFDFIEAVNHDCELVIDRQRGKNYNKDEGKRFHELMEAYLKTLSGTTTQKHQQLSGFLTVAAFLARQPQDGDQN
mgnify:CR=1 FL=1|jgi:hypothetical protein